MEVKEELPSADVAEPQGFAALFVAGDVGQNLPPQLSTG